MLRVGAREQILSRPDSPRPSCLSPGHLTDDFHFLAGVGSLRSVAVRGWVMRARALLGPVVLCESEGHWLLGPHFSMAGSE